jgi:stringent starvation protein B
MSESSTKPYLVRAIHEWCADQGHTPYISVSVDERTIVPRGFVKGGEIVLNVSVMATNRLKISNEFVEFQARFGGVAYDLSIPIENISAIYARETGHGMAFDVTKAPAVLSTVSNEGSASDASAGEGENLTPNAASPAPVSARVTPLLRSVSTGESGVAASDSSVAVPVSTPATVDPVTPTEPTDPPTDPDKPTRPRLTRIK